MFCIIKLVHEWNGEELKIPKFLQVNAKEEVMGMEFEATVVWTQTSSVRHFIADVAEWFEDYIANDYGIIHHFYLAEIVKNRKEENMLGEAYSYEVKRVLFITDGTIGHITCSCISFYVFIYSGYVMDEIIQFYWINSFRWITMFFFFA